MNIEVESVGFDRIMAEISNPRMPTIIAFVAIVFLLGIGFSRRRGGQVVYEYDDEELFDEEDDETEKVTIDIPAPVMDDDLELLDDDLDDIDDEELDISDD